MCRLELLIVQAMKAKGRLRRRLFALFQSVDHPGDLDHCFQRSSSRSVSTFMPSLQSPHGVSIGPDSFLSLVTTVQPSFWF